MHFPEMAIGQEGYVLRHEPLALPNRHLVRLRRKHPMGLEGGVNRGRWANEIGEAERDGPMGLEGGVKRGLGQ